MVNCPQYKGKDNYHETLLSIIQTYTANRDGRRPKQRGSGLFYSTEILFFLGSGSTDATQGKQYTFETHNIIRNVPEGNSTPEGAILQQHKHWLAIYIEGTLPIFLPLPTMFLSIRQRQEIV